MEVAAPPPPPPAEVGAAPLSDASASVSNVASAPETFKEQAVGGLMQTQTNETDATTGGHSAAPLPDDEEGSGAAVPPADDADAVAAAAAPAVDDDEDQKTESAGGEEAAAAAGDKPATSSASPPAPDASNATDEAPATSDPAQKPPQQQQQQQTIAATLPASTPPKLVVPRPALRGLLKRSATNVVTWTGQWGMDDSAFQQPNGLLSDFAYTRAAGEPAEAPGGVPAASLPAGADADLARNAVFGGHFFLAETAKKPKKVAEKRFVLEFSADSALPPGVVKVEGKGTNVYGAYKLDGTLDTTSGQLSVYREYEPRPLLPAGTATAAGGRARGGNNSSNNKRAVGGGAISSSAKAAKRGAGGPAPGRTAKAAQQLQHEQTNKPPPRVRRAPSHLAADALDEGEAQDLTKLKGFVRELMRADRERWFAVPVDPALLGLTNYFEIVKEPMDLGTVMSRLEAREYPAHGLAVEDVRRTFRNALAYNPPATAVHQAARRLQTLFESMVARLSSAARAPRKRKSQGAGFGGQAPKRGKHTMNDLFPSDDEDGAAFDDDDDELGGLAPRPAGNRGRRSVGGGNVNNAQVRALQQELAAVSEQMRQFTTMQMHNMHLAPALHMPQQQQLQLQQQQQQQPAVFGKPQQRDRAAVDMRPLLHQEQRQLGQDINQLPENDVPKVLALLREGGIFLGTTNESGEEVVLDLEKLEPVLQRKLQKLVKRCLAKARKTQGAEVI